MMDEAAWGDLLNAFDADPREAAGRLHQLIEKLVRIFEWRGCHQPEEAAYEVVQRVAMKIHKGATLTTTVERYASGFIRPIFHEFLRKAAREQQMLEELPRHEITVSIDEGQEDHLRHLDTCLEEVLSRGEQDLLMEFHAHDGSERIKSRRRLAEARGKTVNAIRIEAHRLRKRLKACVEACLTSRITTGSASGSEE
ncbi:MAG: hypothetical protein AAFY88_00160 [Acidobacteriota bacterium]